MLNHELMTIGNKVYFDVLVILKCPLLFISFLEIIMALRHHRFLTWTKNELGT
jgi:hypothetical protein